MGNPVTLARCGRIEAISWRILRLGAIGRTLISTSWTPAIRLPTSSWPKTRGAAGNSPIGFSADGKSIYVTSDRDSEFQRIASIDLATRQPKYLTTHSWDVEAAQ